MKNISILVLILSTILTAQSGDWSPARQLSRDGTYPTLNFWKPAIAVSNSGTIHAFWPLDLEIDGDWHNGFYSQIEYRKSNDGGLTWSTTENLTPEYMQHRIMYIKAVCDSKNNVHLVYMRGSEGYEILYKKFDGVSWTTPVLIGYGSSYLRMNIDNQDRIYATWMIGREAYFAYCDNGVWSEYNQIGLGEYGISDIKFDENNILYSSGTCWTDVTPYLFIYDKMVENWIKLEQTTCNPDSSTVGDAIAVSNNGLIFLNYSEGSYNSKNQDVHLSFDTMSNEYSTPYIYGYNNAPEREMYNDRHDYLHLFEKHYYTGGDTMDDMGLLHSIGKNGVWETTVIDSSNEDYSYSEPNVAFDKVNNKFFLTYYKFDKIYQIGRIYFCSKLNTTGIEENSGHTVEDYRLEQNYPNPFNNQTNISYVLSQNCEVELSVFNSNGQIVTVLINSKQSKGSYSIQFNADNLNSGVYYYQLKTNGILRSVKRMVYLK